MLLTDQNKYPLAYKDFEFIVILILFDTIQNFRYNSNSQFCEILYQSGGDYGFGYGEKTRNYF